MSSKTIAHTNRDVPSESLSLPVCWYIQLAAPAEAQTNGIWGPTCFSWYDVLFGPAALLFAETLLGILIIHKVAYTEIDWIAYMQEVSGWWDDGEYDYLHLRGDTGPLVYPAGFLYLFQALRFVTQHGKNIRTAQYIFLCFYLFLQGTVLFLFQQWVFAVRRKFLKTNQHESQAPSDQYNKSNQQQKQLTLLAASHEIWSWRIAMVVLCLSKRLHSIFILRLFNDGPAMLLFYSSVWLFTQQQWDWGCLVYSLAVSIKMNVLLFAPGLLLLLLQTGPDWTTVIVRRLFACCALPQLVLGAPFLLRHPVSYLRKAFELDRVFFYKWTVNWKMLPENMFVSKPWSLILLSCHLGMLGLLAVRWMKQTQNRTGKRIFLSKKLSSHYIVYTLAVANFVGICFARTLHYQFYCWYFHCVVYILWSEQPIPLFEKRNNNLMFWMKLWMRRLGIVAALEVAFLTFPATPFSSTLLQLAHFSVLLRIQCPQEVLDNDDDGHEAPNKAKVY